MRRLLVRPGAVGDCILSFPALQHLLTDYTEIWISSAVVPLVYFSNSVRPLASTGLDLLGVGDLDISPSLKAALQSFDSIVSWYGTNRPDFREALLRVNVNCEFFPALPPAGYTSHATDFFAAQVGAPLGQAPRLRVSGSGSRDGVIIHPFSGSPRKNWPLGNYRTLAAQLPSRVQWTAGPEEELTEAIRFDDLQRLAEWIACARLYIGNDSGITHLAAAAGVPVLALFGPASSAAWTPRGENVRILWSRPLDALPVETVLAAANRLLGSP